MLRKYYKRNIWDVCWLLFVRSIPSFLVAASLFSIISIRNGLNSEPFRRGNSLCHSYIQCIHIATIESVSFFRVGRLYSKIFAIESNVPCSRNICYLLGRFAISLCFLLRESTHYRKFATLCRAV